LDKIATTKGVPKQDLLIEIEKRREFLADLVEKNIRDQGEVAERILAYYTAQKENSKKEEGTKKRRKPSVKRKRYFEDIKREAKPEDVVVEGGDADGDFSSPPSPPEEVSEPRIENETVAEE
jgi:hypothetical protein